MKKIKEAQTPKSAYVKWAFFLIAVFIGFKLKDFAFQVIPQKSTDLEKPFNVITTPIEAHEASIPVQTYGIVKAQNDVILIANISGYFLKKDRKEGSHHQQGSLLFEISNEGHETLYNQAKREHEHRLQVYTAKKKLAAKSYQSQTDLLDAAAKLAQAEHSLETAEKAKGYARIEAPFSGQIAAIFPSDNQWVNKGEKLATFEATPLNRVMFFIQPSQAKNLATGSQAQVDINEKTYTGSVYSISKSADTRTRTLQGFIAIDLPKETIANTNANVVLFPPKVRVMRVPLSSLIIGNDGQIGVMLADNHHAKFQPVTLLSQNEKTAILTAFSDTATLITQGAGFLKDGSLINVAP